MRIYEPLTAEEIDWLRRYVERNPDTSNGRLWGRFLATLDLLTAENSAEAVGADNDTNS